MRDSAAREDPDFVRRATRFSTFVRGPRSAYRRDVAMHAKMPLIVGVTLTALIGLGGRLANERSVPCKTLPVAVAEMPRDDAPSKLQGHIATMLARDLPAARSDAIRAKAKSKARRSISGKDHRM